jgi:cellulose synthase/poly-beta-1,6-N-acetylglucosamine synthase-like glycosyltransferase
LSTGFGALLFILFLFLAWTLTFYSLNIYLLVYYSTRNKGKGTNKCDFAFFPLVTVQLPLYNEKYVACRLIDAVCKLDYPKDRMEIQVLDDSEDDSKHAIMQAVQFYKLKGYDIRYMTRKTRSGYKAGALRMGTEHAKGEYIAIFDADFVPTPEFLKKTLKHFSDPQLGLVQCRWGHINESYSTLTEAQALSLDLHFQVEQSAKSFTHLFMNFNGTAGVWRSSCIQDAGGWQEGTLVEDMDLSYRAQMKGWKLVFDEEIEVLAELPVQMNGAKRQQFRWSKGTTQLAMKLLWELLVFRKIPLDTKFQAFIQLTRNIVYPLFLAQFLILPVLLNLDVANYFVPWRSYFGLIFYVLLGPMTYICVIKKLWPTQWFSKSKQFWFFLIFATGISVNNTIAVFDAMFGKKNEFLRTPKFGIRAKSDKWKHKDYVLPFDRTTLLEVFFSSYGCLAIFVCIFSGNFFFLPIVTIQTIGFVYVTYFSVVESWRKFSTFNKCEQRFSRPPEPMSPNSGTINNINEKASAGLLGRAMFGFHLDQIKTLHFIRSKITVLAFMVLISSGIISAIYGYQLSVYPLDKAAGYLSRVQSAQTPYLISVYLKEAKELIPSDGNPVWTFPNPRTDFKLINQEIDAMQSRVLAISKIAPHSAAYNTALEDLHVSTRIIETNLIEAQPYIYGSLSNIAFTGVWIALILFTYSLVRRNKKKISEAELSEA